MAYQIAKEIGRAVVAASGVVDLIILAGPAFRLDEMTSFVATRVCKWAPVFVASRDLVASTLLRVGVQIASGEAQMSS